MIMVEVSPGELIDKITILRIKLKEISDPDKLKNIEHEHNILCNIADNSLPMTNGKLTELFKLLKSVNETLWDIEDNIRILERNKDFGKDFIETAISQDIGKT